MAAVLTPHLALPFRVENGVVATVEQDSIEEITQCVEACLRTPLGSRIDAPDYGVPDRTFSRLSSNQDANTFLAAVEEVEPRAHLLADIEVEGMVERISVKVATHV